MRCAGWSPGHSVGVRTNLFPGGPRRDDLDGLAASPLSGLRRARRQ